jgi:putative oxidoreductase
VPRTTVYGSVLSLAVMGGAISSHVTTLGITIPAVDDHGELFGLAVVVFSCCLAVLYLHRQDLPLPAFARQ